MIVVGDCGFIKDKFNVGFHVVLAFNEQSKKNIEECKKMIAGGIEGAKEDPQTAANTIKYLFPAGEVKKFAKMFSKLE